MKNTNICGAPTYLRDMLISRCHLIHEKIMDNPCTKKGQFTISFLALAPKEVLENITQAVKRYHVSADFVEIWFTKQTDTKELPLFFQASDYSDFECWKGKKIQVNGRTQPYLRNSHTKTHYVVVNFVG